MTGMRVARIAPWVAAAATACAFAWGIWLDAVGLRVRRHPPGWSPRWFVATFASTGVGLVLATRRGSNPIGWLLLGNGLVLAAMGLADSFADYAVLAHPGALPGGAWAVLFSERAWPLLFVFVTAIAWVFPDGRLPSPRWRPFAIAAAASYAGLVVLSLLAAERFSEDFAGRPSPLPEVSESILGIPFLVCGLAALASLVGGALAVRTRLRRFDGGRAPAGEVARVRGRAHPRGGRRLPDRGRDHGLRRPGDGHRRGRGAHGHPGGGRHRGDALPALRDRPAHQPHAGLRGAQRRPRRGLRRGRRCLGPRDRLAARPCRPRSRRSRSRSLFGPLRGARAARSSTGASTGRATRGCGASSGFLADLRAGRAAPEAIEARPRRGARRSRGWSSCFRLPGERGLRRRARRVVGARRRTGARARRSARRLPLAHRLHDAALGERPDLLDSVIGAAGLAIEIAPPARRGAPAARRGRGIARADRHRRLRGAPAARARPPRRRAAAAGLDRPGAAARCSSSRARGASGATRRSTARSASSRAAIEELRELARGRAPGAARRRPARRARASSRARAPLPVERGGDRRSASTAASRPPPTSSPARR